MRRQDELIALYPGRDTLTRKFILSQAEGLSLAFDSDELLEFLQGEIGDEDPVVRNQALFTLTKFLPGFIKKRYALSSQSMGVWSAYEQDQTKLKQMIDMIKEEPIKALERRKAFLFRAAPVAEALSKLVQDGKDAVLEAARLALAQYPVKSVANQLSASCRGPSCSFAAALPYALVTGANGRDSDLAEIIRKHAINEPDLCLLLSALDPKEALQSLLDLADKVDCLGRVNLTQVLSQLTGVDQGESLEKLISHKEGWVTVYALRTIEILGQERYLGMLKKCYEGTSNEFVKGQSIRAAGGIVHPESRDLCLRALKGSSEGVKAQALETLVRLRCEPDLLAKIATPLLKSPSLRARVNAILATTKARVESFPRALQELLTQDHVDRLEAAYCLGYIQNRRALAYLSTLVSLDPNTNVKLQAVKSLSKYPARYSLPNLLPILKSNDGRVALTAARVLARYTGEEGQAVCQALTEEVRRSDGVFHRALLYRTIGTLAGCCGVSTAIEVLREGLRDKQPKVVLGAVEGLNVLGGKEMRDETQIMRQIVTTGDRRAAPRALMALINSGDLGAIDDLATLLRQLLDRNVTPSIETALELGLLVAAQKTEVRYPLLTDALDSVKASQAFKDFDEREKVEPPDLRWLENVSPKASQETVDDEFNVSRALRRDTGKGSQTLDSGKFPIRDSGKFPIRDSGKFPIRKSTFSAPIALGDDPDGRDADVANLKQHLNKPHVQQQSQSKDFNQKLRKQTYLVGEGVAEPTLAEKLKRYKVLAIPALASFVILVTVTVAMAQKLLPKPVEVYPPLCVEYTFGDIKSGGKKLEPGDELVKGVTLSTRENERLRLYVQNGNRIFLGASSSLTIETLDKGTLAMGLSVTPGDLRLEFAKEEGFEVECGRHKLSGEKAAFSIKKDEGKLVLSVDEGRVAVDESGVGRREVEAVGSLSLE